MSSPKRECLGDLTWREALGVLSLSSGQPSVLRHLLLGVGNCERGAVWECPESRASRLWPDGRLDNAPSAPTWMLSWVNKIEFITLFSAEEDDHTEGVAFLVCDKISKEYWFGVSGGLEEVFDSKVLPEELDTRLSEMQRSYGNGLWKIPVCGRDIDANDLYEFWSGDVLGDYDYNVELFSNVKVYDSGLFPPDHIRRFVMKYANTYVVDGRLGFDEDWSGLFVSVDDFVERAYSDSPNDA
jgi:hypothetical protein